MNTVNRGGAPQPRRFTTDRSERDFDQAKQNLNGILSRPEIGVRAIREMNTVFVAVLKLKQMSGKSTFPALQEMAGMVVVKIQAPNTRPEVARTLIAALQDFDADATRHLQNNRQSQVALAGNVLTETMRTLLDSKIGELNYALTPQEVLNLGAKIVAANRAADELEGQDGDSAAKFIVARRAVIAVANLGASCNSVDKENIQNLVQVLTVKLADENYDEALANSITNLDNALKSEAFGDGLAVVALQTAVKTAKARVCAYFKVILKSHKDKGALLSPEKQAITLHRMLVVKFGWTEFDVAAPAPPAPPAAPAAEGPKPRTSKLGSFGIRRGVSPPSAPSLMSSIVGIEKETLPRLQSWINEEDGEFGDINKEACPAVVRFLTNNSKLFPPEVRGEMDEMSKLLKDNPASKGCMDAGIALCQRIERLESNEVLRKGVIENLRTVARAGIYVACASFAADDAQGGSELSDRQEIVTVVLEQLGNLDHSGGASIQSKPEVMDLDDLEFPKPFSGGGGGAGKGGYQAGIDI